MRAVALAVGSWGERLCRWCGMPTPVLLGQGGNTLVSNEGACHLELARSRKVIMLEALATAATTLTADSERPCISAAAHRCRLCGCRGHVPHTATFAPPTTAATATVATSTFAAALASRLEARPVGLWRHRVVYPERDAILFEFVLAELPRLMDLAPRDVCELLHPMAHVGPIWVIII